MKIYNYSLYAATALLIVACSQDLAQTSVEAIDNTISFSAQTISAQIETRSVSVPDALPLKGDGLELCLLPTEEDMLSDATRGTQINSVETLNNFGVSAYKHGAIPSGKTQNEYLTEKKMTPDFFYNIEAAKVSGTQNFKLKKDYFWPNDTDVVSFFAYAPYGDENVELSSATQEGPQSVFFKVNTDVKEQADFIIAQAVSTSHLNTSQTPSVALNFTHQLTGIRFVIGDQFLKGWIKSISLKGVYTQGTYTIGGDWTLDDTKKGNFTISYNLDKPVVGTSGEEVSASDEVFMMIPHTFADDDAATIEVVYNDKYTDYVVSCPLKGQTWKAGKTITYAITSNKLTTLRIGQIQYADTPEGAPRRVWKSGDKIGMYVVSSDGKKLKHKNVPVTFDGTNWNIDHNTSEGTIYKLPGESFYFYYPYSTVSNNQPLGYPEQCPELKASAATFFEGVINYFNVKSDQSTLDNFLASNLMVARAEDDGHASTIMATMERQTGLAVIVLGSKSAKKKVTFLNGSTSGTVNETANVMATDVFATGGNKPYQNGEKFYFNAKANAYTAFNSSTSVKDAWHEALEFYIGAGETKTLTAYSDRAWWDYINAVWNYEYAANNNYTFTAAPQGTYTYTLQVWGAQGGGFDSGSSRGGKGGYSYGNYSLSASGNLYICVGGRGYVAASGGYNGGAQYSTINGHSGGGGGGATHIATAKRGVLKNYASYKSEVLVVAGGGGGSDDSGGDDGSGGTGGGTSGGNAYDGGTLLSGTSGAGRGATQTTGYAFGQGQTSAQAGAPNDAGGGGGGWYGGYGGNGNAMGGGGGSGYTNTSKLTSYGMSNGQRLGNGYATITLTRW